MVKKQKEQKKEPRSMVSDCINQMEQQENPIDIVKQNIKDSLIPKDLQANNNLMLIEFASGQRIALSSNKSSIKDLFKTAKDIKKDFFTTNKPGSRSKYIG